MNQTTSGKYVWQLKQKDNTTPTLKWYIVKSGPSYSNITNSCMLCLHEKFEIMTHPNQDEVLNKRSELVSKYRHIKYLLCNCAANDGHSVSYISHNSIIYLLTNYGNIVSISSVKNLCSIYIHLKIVE